MSAGTATASVPLFRPRLTVSPAFVIVICSVALTFLGLSVLFSASASFKQGPYFYLGKQITGVVAAGLVCFAVSRLNLDYIRKYAKWIAGISLFLLFLVLIPHIGIRTNGSRRWLGLGPLRLQVSEFAKLAMAFCLAHYLALNQTKISEFKRGYLYPIGIIIAFAGLIAGEPDLGTAALVLTVGVVILFLAGAQWKYIIPTIFMSLAGFAFIVVNMPNRLRRLTAFLDVEGNKDSGTYQLYQCLSAFAAGGTTGEGLGQGRQQINFLPEAHTDCIFAVLGEELGLWFTLGVVAIFATIFWAGLRHLRKAPNLFHFLFTAGCLMMLCLQSIINIGVVTGVLPTKGMSLPFISAGLSNLLLMGMLVGVFLNNERTWGKAAMPSADRSMREVSA
jgi:cell division protein FtsW